MTVDNFVRAESDMYFAMFVERGAFGRFFHLRELPLEEPGVRPNRDTLYSHAVFDLGAGPVTITLPDAGDRFLSMIVIDEDHYVVEVVYGAAAYTYAKEQVGTRYVFASVRMLVDPNTPVDVEQVHALQDAITASQHSSGTFEFPTGTRCARRRCATRCSSSTRR